MTEIAASKIQELNRLHDEILGAVRTTLNKAIEAGKILTEIKDSLPHGEFTDWIEENVAFDLRTAQRYMKAYRNRDKIKNDNVSSLSQAYRYMTHGTTDVDIDFSGVTAQQAIKYMRNCHADMKARLDKLTHSVLLEDWETASGVEPLSVPQGFVERWKALLESIEDLDTLLEIANTTDKLEGIYSEFAMRKLQIMGQYMSELEEEE